MSTVWVDTSVLVRFLTKEPPALAARARSLMARAASGELRLRVASLVVAEVVWVLSSYYRLDDASVAERVSELLAADGVDAEEEEAVLESLRVMQEKNVSFVDAYLAQRGGAAGEAVATFDRDFARLGVGVVAV